MSDSAVDWKLSRWDLLIKEDVHLLRVFLACIAVILALSTILGIVSLFDVIGSTSVTYMLQVGSACIAVLGNVVPAQQYLTHYQRLRGLRLYREQQDGPPPPAPEMLEFLDQMYWKLLERIGVL